MHFVVVVLAPLLPLVPAKFVLITSFAQLVSCNSGTLKKQPLGENKDFFGHFCKLGVVGNSLPTFFYNSFLLDGQKCDILKTKASSYSLQWGHVVSQQFRLFLVGMDFFSGLLPSEGTCRHSNTNCLIFQGFRFSNYYQYFGETATRICWKDLTVPDLYETCLAFLSWSTESLFYLCSQIWQPETINQVCLCD